MEVIRTCNADKLCLRQQGNTKLAQIQPLCTNGEVLNIANGKCENLHTLRRLRCLGTTPTGVKCQRRRGPCTSYSRCQKPGLAVTEGRQGLPGPVLGCDSFYDCTSKHRPEATGNQFKVCLPGETFSSDYLTCLHIPHNGSTCIDPGPYNSNANFLILEYLNKWDKISNKGPEQSVGIDGHDILPEDQTTAGTMIQENTGRPGKPGPHGIPGRPGTDGRPGRPGTDGRPERPGTDGRPERPGTDGRPGRPGTDGRPGRPGTDGRPGRPGTHGRPGRPGTDDRPDTGGRPGRPGTDDRPGRPGANDKTGRPDADSRPGRPSTSDRPVRPVTPGRPSTNGRPGQPDTEGRPGRPGRPDIDGRPGRPDSDGKPGRPDTDGRPGRPDTDGRPGQPDTDGRPGRPDSDGKPGRPDSDGKPGRPDSDGRPGRPDTDGKPGRPDSDGRPGRPDIDGRPGRPDSDGKPGLPDSDGRPGRPDTDGKPGRPDSDGNPGRPDSDGRPGRPDSDGKPGRPDTDGKPGRPDSDGRPGRPDSDGKPGRPDTDGKPGRPDSDGRPGRPDTDGKPGRPDTDGRPGRPDSDGKPGRPDSDGKPLRPVSDGRPGRPDTDGKPGRPESDGRPGRPDSDGKPGRPDSDGKPERRGSDGRPGRPDTDGKPGRPDSDGNPGRPDSDGRPGRPDTDGKPGRPDSDGNPGRPDSDGRPRRPDIDGRPGRLDTDGRPSKPDITGRPGRPDAGGRPRATDEGSVSGGRPLPEARPISVSRTVSSGKPIGNAGWPIRSGLQAAATRLDALRPQQLTRLSSTSEQQTGLDPMLLPVSGHVEPNNSKRQMVEYAPYSLSLEILDSPANVEVNYLGVKDAPPQQKVSLTRVGNGDVRAKTRSKLPGGPVSIGDSWKIFERNRLKINDHEFSGNTQLPINWFKIYNKYNQQAEGSITDNIYSEIYQSNDRNGAEEESLPVEQRPSNSLSLVRDSAISSKNQRFLSSPRNSKMNPTTAKMNDVLENFGCQSIGDRPTANGHRNVNCTIKSICNDEGIQIEELVGCETYLECVATKDGSLQLAELPCSNARHFYSYKHGMCGDESTFGGEACHEQGSSLHERCTSHGHIPSLTTAGRKRLCRTQAPCYVQREGRELCRQYYQCYTSEGREGRKFFSSRLKSCPRGHLFSYQLMACVEPQTGRC
ncbi:collagen alpha-1(IV) chain isoform X2 [Hyalella azteca]|uniref:Collagen alpha-1(IV) chain isoform X2 n=1 Tax=Hyalella azteca TaxID=294128 RepID=A0A979FLF9_HYAAZ|nr:collagen alpha-1(IV) chain isoform X2 [Hyalella azteca]